MLIELPLIMLQLICICLVVIIIYWYLARPRNLPPGPAGIPLLGYLPWLIYYSKDRPKLVEGLEKYGNIVCIRIGFNYIVFLNDIDIIREAFATHGDRFSGRGLKLIQSEITHCKGIVSSEGKYQRENRKFIRRSLRNMGFGKISFENHIIDSIDGMCEQIDDHISRHPEKSFDFKICLMEAIIDNITRIIFGTKFDKAQIAFVFQQLEIAKDFPMILILANSFPILKPFMKFKIVQKMTGMAKYKEAILPLDEMIRKIIEKHKSTFDRDNINDFLHSYIDEQADHQETKEDAFWWDDEQINRACTELFSAGIDTTLSSISWSFFAMANNPDWQEKVINEIDSVIGRERKPSTRDLPTLPLSEASILETLRWSNIVDFGVPHSTTENAHLLGYFIPKDSTVLANLYKLSRNENVWLDPCNFNPAANFLSPDKNEVINRDKFIPFSVGRRSCIGEPLARMELTLFFIALFQKYTVSLDPKVGMASANNGVLKSPLHSILQFHSRT